MIKWEKEVENIKFLINGGKAMAHIAKLYDVSRQRLYQVMTKHGIDNPSRKRKNLLKDKPASVYWLNRSLCNKRIPKDIRNEILSNYIPDDKCPVFDLPLDYSSKVYSTFRNDSTPCVERIFKDKDYSFTNIVVVSYRASRIISSGSASDIERVAIWKDNLVHDGLKNRG